MSRHERRRVPNGDQGAGSLGADFRPWLTRLGRRRRRLWLGAALMLLTAVSGIGLLALSGWFITATALTGALIAAGVAASIDVYVPGGGIRAFAISRTVARYAERLYNHDTVLRVLADLRRDAFAVLTRLDGRELARLRASEWLNRLTADIDTLDGLYLRLLAPPLVALLAALGVGVLLGVFVPIAALAVTLLLLALWAWLVIGQARLGMAPGQRRVATQDRLRSRIIELLEGLAELRGHGALDDYRRRLGLETRALYADQRRLASRQALGSALAGLGVSAAAVLALWLGARAYEAQRIGGAVMVMLPLAVLALNEVFGALPTAFTPLGGTRAAARRLNALEARQGGIAAPGTPQPLPDGRPGIALQAVTLHYPGAPVPALDDVSLAITPGERLALLGASGAGKSSIGQLLVRQLDPTAGTLRFNGVDLRRVAPARLRRRIGYLTQRSELFQASLADNLRLADAQVDEAALWRALEIVELADWAAALPVGLETWVGESGRRLSGGQARRLALARVLLTRAELVILDEPFTGVDAATAARIAARLDAWLEGRTVLYLAHDDAWLPGVTRTLTLREGQL
ncbi:MULTISPECIES: thiol reductant ABC exporter subunit CydC [unclassified Modicisalibacter]|uniref:thiol reductant ABC exporter subunit CydC n=1 Tax=unclassified Modicisalibacter TaxID=2679913 RepID=UPI001CCB94AD|nr:MULTISPECIES: thiol reductant ABC exporter subunit CydC [unclassified Modicisalibacter]MBZ9556930.1 thiol reductant ABC exporter subunit CydC [Modicisalibacter sp. R2A 31.J]MBZ9574357.1 thiol reductant ABC exporter subunit CydC [Modicisalibacter sp. MOD 31.J]